MSERPVNFVFHPSPNYAGVQEQLFSLVEAELSTPVTRTVNERAPHALNFGVHIRLGRADESRPMPLDVLMSHGLADKGYFLSRDTVTGHRLVNAYEHVLVAGPWFKERLLRRRWHPDPRRRVRLSPEQVHVVGWPRLDAALGAQPRRSAPAPDRRLNLLWAPSHDTARVGDDRRALSSYPAFEKYLPRLQERFDVRVSLHPRNRSSKEPTSDALEWADIVVSDFGTMLYEAWALEKCVILPSWLMPEEMTTQRRFRNTAEGQVYARRIGNHASSIDELEEMASRCEPPGQDVRRLMEGHLSPAHRGRSAACIAALLTSLPLRRRH